MLTGWLALRTTKQLQDQARLSARTEELNSRVGVLLATYRGMESERRVYALTGEAVYRKSHDSLANELQPRLAEVAEIAFGDPKTAPFVDSLRVRLSEARRFSMLLTQVRADSGFAPAAAMVRGGEGRQHGDAVAQLSRHLLGNAEQIRVTRAAAVATSARRTVRIITFGTGLALVLILIAVAALLREIRENAETRAALAAGEERLKDFLDNANDLVHSVGPDGRFLYVNEAWRRTLGYTEDEVKRLHLLDIVAPESRERAAVALKRVLEGASIQNAEFTLRAKDGRTIVVAGSSNCRMVDGVPVATRTILRDITRLKEVERLKDEFLSVVSHELRTPLTAIRGALGLVASGRLAATPEKSTHMLGVALTNTDRLIRLINDILDVERLESGKVDLQPRPVSAHDLAVAAVDAIRPMLEAARIECTIDVPGLWVDADPDRIIQTLTNLLGNAVKFSPPESTITVSAAQQGRDVLFSVRDQGRGIPADKVNAIFERFQQVDASDSRERGGTGLGLAICRGIVRQHGGRIWAESIEGKGSTLRFTLHGTANPATGEFAAVRAPEHPPIQAVSRTSPPALDEVRTVLIIEDDDELLQVLGATAQARGYQVVRAGSAVAALELMETVPIDCIVVDLLLPDYDGIELVERIRASPTMSSCPMIAYTALELDASSRERLQRLGTDVAMKGKASPDQVITRVQEILQQTS